MKFKGIFIGLSILSVMIFTGCGDDDDNTAQLGIWLASSVELAQCDNASLNGPLANGCNNDIGNGNSFSCIRLNLTQDSYTLSINFDSSQTNEVGTWSSSQGNLQLCPTLGACYNLSISTSDFDNMTINLPRNGGCVAVAQMLKN